MERKKDFQKEGDMMGKMDKAERNSRMNMKRVQEAHVSKFGHEVIDRRGRVEWAV